MKLKICKKVGNFHRTYEHEVRKYKIGLGQLFLSKFKLNFSKFLWNFRTTRYFQVLVAITLFNYI